MPSRADNRRRAWGGRAGPVLALLAILAFVGAKAAAPDAPQGEGTRAVVEPGKEPSGPHPLAWDALEKTLDAKPGAQSMEFQFSVTNVSERAVTIEQLRPTCGCTVVEMPETPWVLAPGSTGTFVGTIDLRGKDGLVSKAIFVNSTAGTQRLTLSVRIPTLDSAARMENQKIARQNRQAVFAGDCARCHLEPAKGLSGGELFTAACGVCHFSPHRGTVVPDLLTARQHRDANFWRTWITAGKDGTLMPAWSQRHGGPLSDAQIESLVKFALEMLPTEPPAAPAPAERG